MVLSFKASCPNLKVCSISYINLKSKKSKRNCPVKFKQILLSELMKEKGQGICVVMACRGF